MNTPSIGSDGFYHPSTEEELQSLVKKAVSEGRECRVRGSVHSVACAIYTDPCQRNVVGVQTPPSGDDINIMLDRYIEIVAVDEARKLVTVQAGIHLGKDPYDPTGTSTIENSLLYQLQTKYGWTLSDLGGITHQTVAGFLSTGSSGGSLTYSLDPNVHAFRIVDGNGDVYEVSADDTDPSEFCAAAVSVGLLGLISTVTFKCVDTFNISGQEAITTIEEAAVDLFGDSTPERPSLQDFLTNVEYTRLLWYPQRGAERLTTWQAQRIEPQPGFIPTPYLEFGNNPEATQLLISIFYTIIGNLDDLSAAKGKLEDNFDQLEKALDALLARNGQSTMDQILAKVISGALEFGVDVAITILIPFARIIKSQLPELMVWALNTFVELDKDKKGAAQGTPQAFRDYGWTGLPMDNQADDILLATEFTEIWIPIGETKKTMNTLKDYFDAASSNDEAIKRTGTYSWELYGAGPSHFWMSPSYSNGQDKWKDGVVRVDIFWYSDNAGDPAQIFYPQFWKLLRDAGISFRLHWGKYLPIIEEGDPEGWVEFFKSQYERWDDFLALRQKKDPRNIFLTDYWRGHFGLRALPKPGAVS